MMIFLLEALFDDIFGGSLFSGCHGHLPGDRLNHRLKPIGEREAKNYFSFQMFQTTRLTMEYFKIQLFQTTH
jgi:hypothetical protein